VSENVKNSTAAERGRDVHGTRGQDARDTVTSVVLVGVGGQGILLASEVVARAAMRAGFDVKTNEVHGMAQRGGSVVAQIRYGRRVFSPLVPDGQAVVLGSLERIEALRYTNYLAPDGLAVVSSQAIVPVTVSSGQATYPADARERLTAAFANLVYVEAEDLARQAGTVRAANLVVVGAMSRALDLPPEAWRAAIEQSVAAKHVAANLKAFEFGQAAR